MLRIATAALDGGAIRSGALAKRLPVTFPFDQGSDSAGVAVGTGAEVLGWTWDRRSHTEYVLVPETQMVPKPATLGWETAGSRYVAGATTKAVGASEGEVMAVPAAVGGVGAQSGLGRAVETWLGARRATSLLAIRVVLLLCPARVIDLPGASHPRLSGRGPGA